jgi:hypothetical protein
MLFLQNAYSGGPRLDYDEAYKDVPGAPECWVNGYDAGFAGKYDKNRAVECKKIDGDQYNTAWIYGCEQAGYTHGQCNNFKTNSETLDHEKLNEENAAKCRNDGYQDGLKKLFDFSSNQGCDDYGNSYYKGFMEGCTIIKGNTEESCDKLTYR